MRAVVFDRFGDLPEVREVADPSCPKDGVVVEVAATAASLGCRFATAYRAVTELARVRAGDQVVVHGCGGVGLAAVMIARWRGASVIGVDIEPTSLQRAGELGAEVLLDARNCEVAEAVRELTGGGADISIDALGSRKTLESSLRCLRNRGTHVQVGLLAGTEATPPVPMEVVVGAELVILGSHGMAAASYPAMLAEIADHSTTPQMLIKDRITLEQAPVRLAGFGETGAGAGGVTIIRP